MIKAIDKASVHRICSGQVIISLALAVKELVENSLDASSQNIEVRLKEYGRELIEVVDDGCGVEEKDFEGLGLKHHTSKLQEFSDLTGLATFGFRGEALSSLCALSNLTVATRHESSPVGFHLTFDHNGHLVNKTPCARQVGTTVSLQGLFSPLPVRHKEFQQNLKREFGKMVNVLTSYSLIGLKCRFLCTNQTSSGKKTTVLSTSGLSTIKENIASVFGSKQVASLKQIVLANEISKDVMDEYRISEKDVSQESPFRIEGFISTCEHGKGRTSSDRQFYFVNSRPCDMPKVSKVINSTFHFYNRHQYPFVLLNVTTRKDTIDINVTPDKRKILVHQEKMLLASIKTTLQQLYDSIMPNVTVADSDSLLNHFQKLNNNQVSPVVERSSQKRPVESPDSKECKAARISDSADDSGPQRYSEDRVENSGNNFTKIKEIVQRKNTTVLSSPELERNACKNPLENLLKFQRISSSFPTINKLKEKPTTPTITQFLQKSESDKNSESASLRETIDYTCETDSLSQIIDDASDSVIVDAGSEIQTDSKAYEAVSHTFIAQETRDIVFQELESCSQKELHETSKVETDEYVNSADVNFSSSTKVQNECYEHSRTTLENEIVITDDVTPCEKHTVYAEFSLEALKERLNLGPRSVSSGPVHRKFRAKISPSDNENAVQELRKALRKDMFKEMEVLGQFNLGFILTKLGTDLFIVDQHATDEKYNYEMLQRDTVFQTQKLVVKQQLELTAVNEAIVIDNLDIFKRNGFELETNEEANAGKRLQLVSIPISKNWTFGKEDIEELIFMLSDSPGVMCRPSKVHQMFASRACRKSVMIGQALTISDMKKLLIHMGEIDQPWNCPHGRPTIRHIFNLALLRDHSQN